MLVASNRLRSRRDIARVFQRGRFATDGPVSVKVAANHLDYSRAVVVVSKKVSKKAVVRNRIRRRVAAVLAAEWATVTPGYDIVVTLRDDVAEAAAPELTRRVVSALQQVHVYAKKP